MRIFYYQFADTASTHNTSPTADQYSKTFPIENHTSWQRSRRAKIPYPSSERSGDPDDFRDLTYPASSVIFLCVKERALIIS
jgi:hypothetical protein